MNKRSLQSKYVHGFTVFAQCYFCVLVCVQGLKCEDGVPELVVSGSEVPEPRSSQREAGSTDCGLDGRMML